MAKEEDVVEVEVKLSLPDSVAREAEASGLLKPESLQSLLREELRRRRVDRLFEAADRLAAVPIPPLTEAELAGEIEAARARRRSPDAGGR
jgi:hypothetical protein